MIETTRITHGHLDRGACVYVRQASAAQVKHNRESTERQYRLSERAVTLGWTPEQVQVVDDDLGVSGAGTADRSGFAHLTLTRKGSPGSAERASHVLGWKRERGKLELMLVLPDGTRSLIPAAWTNSYWSRGGPGGTPRSHAPTLASLISAIRTVFERFAELGSAHQVWLWFRPQQQTCPMPASTAESPGADKAQGRHTSVGSTRRQMASRDRGSACEPPMARAVTRTSEEEHIDE